MADRLSNEDLGALLDQIREANGNVLTPRAVVDAARDVNHPLHSRFTWDDGEAGELWRLEEAAKLIRVVRYKTALPNQGEVKIRKYVSLASDRASGTSQYRLTTDVMSTRAGREQLLQQALAELEALQVKYQILEELCEVWGSVENVKNKHRRA